LNGSVARVPGATMGGSVRKVCVGVWVGCCCSCMWLYVYLVVLFVQDISLSFASFSHFFNFRFLFVYLNPRAMYYQCFSFKMRVTHMYISAFIHMCVCVCLVVDSEFRVRKHTCFLPHSFHVQIKERVH
jgi:hypothetical protein